MIKRIGYAATLWFLGPVLVANAAAPMLEYLFNDQGISTTSTGALNASLEFFDQDRSAADLHSAAGLGVAGDLQGHRLFGVDRSFDNSAAAGMQSPGGIALNAEEEVIPSLLSWTVTGWYKTADEVPLQGGGTVLFMTPPVFTGDPGLANAGFAVRAENPNGIRVSVNGMNTPSGTSGVDEWMDTQTWVFFAVTYDGDLDGENLSFYRGYRNALEGRTAPQVTLIETASFPLGATRPAPGLSIGNRTDDFSRAFDGLLDNMRLFGSASDQLGALSLAELEQLRASDLALIGDIDMNLQFTAADIDGLNRAIREGSTEVTRYDVDNNGTLNEADRQYWVKSIVHSYFGDANLDGSFNSGDLVSVFAAGQYEDSVLGNSTWATGDWSGDAEFTTDDLIVAFQDGGFEKATSAATAAVPEPMSSSLLAGWITLMIARRTRVRHYQ